MAGINDIPRLKITRNSEADVGTVAEAGAGALVMVRPMPAPTPAPLSVPVRIVGPGFAPDKFPANVPWKNPGIVRWGGVWGLALSLQGDSIPRPLRKLEDDLGELERRIRKEESELDDLLKTPAHTVLTDPTQAERNNRRVFEKVQLLAVLNIMKELLELKFEKQRLMANGGSDVEVSVLGAKIHYLEMTLAEEQASHSTTRQRSTGIVASAGGDTTKASAEDQKATASQDTPDTGRLPVFDVPAMVLGKSLGMFDARVKQFQDELVKRQLEGQSPETILSWIHETVIPELEHIQNTPSQILRMPTLSAAARQMADEVKHKLAATHKWANLVRKSDVQTVADAMDTHLKAIKLELLSKIDHDENAKVLSQWFESTVMFEIDVMLAMSRIIATTPEARKIFHDVNNRYTHFTPLTSLYLSQERTVEARRLCEYHGNSLMGMVADLQSQYGGIANVEFVGFPDIIFAPGVNTDRVWGILQNLVSNGGEHPKTAGERTPITLVLKISSDGIHLVYRDLGKGMKPETVAHIMSGVRVHNGAIVSDDDAEARHHGFGSQNIRQYAKELGVTFEITSKVGAGTVYDLRLPAGMLEPNPASYVVANRDRLVELRHLIEQMPVDRRLQVVGDLKEVGFKVTTELLKKLVEDPHSEHPELRAQARLLRDRFAAMLDALYMDLPVTRDTAPKMQENALEAERLRAVLKRIAEYIE